MLFLALLTTAALYGDTTGSNAYMDRYREINALAPRSDKAAKVVNLVLHRDPAEILLIDGTLYLLTPVGGRTVGAVFRGAAKITMTPPHPAEQEAMQRLINAPALDDSVTEIVLLFSDSTLGELRAGADWSGLGGEYWGDAPPSTPLGVQDARFWGLA